MPLVKLAVLIVTFPGVGLPAYDVIDATRSEMAAVESFYAAQSYGRFMPKADVFGVYTIERPVTPTSASDARQQVAVAAKQAAASHGVDLAPYQLFAYILPQTQYIGAGYGDRSGLWFALHPSFPATPQFQIIAHELGHFLGLNHARGCAYSDQTPLGSNGGTCLGQFNQGDTLDVMGHGYLSFNPIAKQQLGWLDANQIVTVKREGDYAITPYGTQGGVKVLIVHGGTNRFPVTYWLHYRRPVGADAGLNPWTNEGNIFNGAILNLPGTIGAQLLKMTPSESASIDTPALEVGQTWCESTSQRIALTPIGATDSGLTVRITVGRCK